LAGNMLIIHMRIAVALFNNNVSPRLDIADSVMLYHVNRGRIKKKEMCALQCELPDRVAAYLKQVEAGIILCGSCPGYFSRILETTGFEVVCCQCGQPDQIVARFIQGRNPGMDSKSKAGG